MTWNTVYYDNSASTTNTYTSQTTSATNDNTHHWRVYSGTGQSSATWNGWWIEGYDSSTNEHYRLQFAHYPSARYNVRKVRCSTPMAGIINDDDVVAFTHPEIITVEYAPLEEMREVEPKRFNEYLDRLRRDPAFRHQQLEQQDRLFLNQRMLGMWTIDGFNLLHRFMEHYRDMHTIEGVRDIILHLWEQDNLLNASGILPPPTRDANGALATEFMGVRARWDELQSLHEIFAKYPIEVVKEVYEKRKQMYSNIERLEQQIQTITDEELQAQVPPLTVEQLHKISENAERLLREVLTPAEYDGLIKDGHVRIPSQQDPEVIYIVKRNPTERIEVHRKGKLEEKLCIYFKEKLPDDDLALAKIMMAKNNEPEMLAIANHFKVSAPPDLRPNPVHIEGLNIDTRVTPPIEVRS